MGGATFGFSYFSLDLHADALNKTVFGNTWKAFMAGILSGKLTLRGPYNNGSMPVTQGGTLTIAIKLSATTIATGDVYVEDIKIVGDANDGNNPVMLEITGPTTGTWTVTIT